MQLKARWTTSGFENQANCKVPAKWAARGQGRSRDLRTQESFCGRQAPIFLQEQGICARRT